MSKVQIYDETGNRAVHVGNKKWHYSAVGHSTASSCVPNQICCDGCRQIVPNCRVIVVFYNSLQKIEKRMPLDNCGCTRKLGNVDNRCNLRRYFREYVFDCLEHPSRLNSLDLMALECLVATVASFAFDEMELRTLLIRATTTLPATDSRFISLKQVCALFEENKHNPLFDKLCSNDFRLSHVLIYDDAIRRGVSLTRGYRYYLSGYSSRRSQPYCELCA